MKKVMAALALALLTAVPAAGQTVNATPAELKALRDSLALQPDSVCRIRTQNSPSTQLRNTIGGPCSPNQPIGRLRRYVAALDAILSRPPVPAMQPPAPDTTPVKIIVSPFSGASVVVGDTTRFRAACVDAQGDETACAINWRPGNPGVASIDQAGLARGSAPGLSDIWATSGVLSAFSKLEVKAPVPPDTTPAPTPPGTCSRTIAGVTIQGNLLVQEGERVCLGAGVQVRGNVLVPAGTLQMRAGASLTFLGANPDNYVGGGLEYAPEFNSDIGLWVWGTGKLDIACTPKLGWNRTGTDPTWRATDEYWIAATNAAEFAPRRWTPGQPVPRVGGPAVVPATEVVNVTRDCSITGPGHIHIHSQVPQRIEYVRLNRMGVSNVASRGPVLGRYAVHTHMMGDASRGTTIRGLACVDCEGKVFVPHASHGITMIDNVVVNSWGEGMWWDQGHVTSDLMIDRLAVLGVRMPDSIGGGPSGIPAFHLGCGTNVEIRNSVASGVQGTYQTAGFDWPEPTTPFQPCVSLLVWLFNVGNVGHNNAGPAVRFWTNNQDLHDVSNFVTYRNKIAGVENGAYFSATQYHNIVSFEDGYQGESGINDAAGFFNNASATVNTLGVMQLTNCNITSLDGPAMKVGHRQLPATHHFLVQDCTFTANGNPSTVGVPLPKWPLVWVHFGTNPWLAHFVRTNVLPEDIVFENDAGNNGSEILIDHADGRKWRVTYENNQKVVRNR